MICHNEEEKKIESDEKSRRKQLDGKFSIDFSPISHHFPPFPIKILVGNRWEISHRGGKLMGILHRTIFPSSCFPLVENLMKFRSKV